MKKRTRFFQFALAASLAFSAVAGAVNAVAATKDIPVGSSGQIEMVGTIEPTILSVTMPTFVAFDISNSITYQNKVVSPRINVKNNSNVPVQIDVAYTKVDLSKIENAVWSNTGTVNENEIAIGLKKEENENEMPETLAHAKWLRANEAQDTNVMVLDANQKGAMYVVGTLGQKVSESATFNVTPTFVVSRTSID